MEDSRGAQSDENGRRGLTRRDMIRASAVAGAAAWTAPVILDSLVSPAAAVSGLSTGISHIDIVFKAGSGAPCGLTSGAYYELYWNTLGWAAPGVGNRCADATHMFQSTDTLTCVGGTGDGPMCLMTTLNGIDGLVTTDSCGCIELHTNNLPTGISTCINHSRTYCGTTNPKASFHSNGLDPKCTMPCTSSAGNIIRFCCESNACCSGSVDAGCNC